MDKPVIRILLVDDDEDDCFITKDLLSDIRGWKPELDWAQDFESALAVLDSESHDVYLLDYRLGAKDGLALMREVIARKRNAPVILLTGQDDPEIDIMAMQGGAADFLVKGQISSSLLERSIRYAVEHHRSQQQLLRREEQLAEAEKLKSIGQLAAGIAHEINTPTQFVGHNIQFLKEAFKALLESDSTGPKGDDETVSRPPGGLGEIDLDYFRQEVPRALEQSLSGIERVSNIVRSVSELAHPDRKTRVLVDLNRAVEAAVVLTANEWRVVANVVTDLAPDLPPLSCVPGAIDQVLINLLINAAQATAVHLGAGEKGEIRVNTTHSEGWIGISVADEAGGIPEEIRPRIFDPFFTTKSVGQSTGQGLAIAHNIVVGQHGGRLMVESEEWAGSTFTVLLPVSPREQASHNTDGNSRSGEWAEVLAESLSEAESESRDLP